jgi:hypothetical protein
MAPSSEQRLTDLTLSERVGNLAEEVESAITARHTIQGFARVVDSVPQTT